MPRLCSFGCKPSETPTHRFPNPDKFPEQFKAWVNVVGGKLENASDVQYYRKKIVCNKHFQEQDKNRNDRLNRLAVPSRHIPDQVVTLSYSQAQAVSTEQRSASNSGPASSSSSNTDRTFNPSQANLKEGSISSLLRATFPTPNTGISHDGAPATTTRHHVFREHNYTVISRPKWTPSKDALTKNYTYSSKVHPLRTQVKRLRTEIVRLRKKGQSFEARLANAENLTSNVAFQHIVRNMTLSQETIITAIKDDAKNQHQQEWKKVVGLRHTKLFMERIESG